MFSQPLLRRLVRPALLLFIVFASIRLYLQFTSLIKTDILQHILVESSARSSYNFSFEAALSAPISLQDRFLSHYHSSIQNLPSNPHVIRVLRQGNQQPNTYTGHVRLSNIAVLNISMVPPATEGNADEFKNNKYFNPAMLPLPSYVSSSSSTPYQYLLVSRLVTSGTHQESHICFARICAPPGSASRSHPCSDDDIDLLGPAGGMRCVTKPEKVNIPATPAKKCTGPWKVFPDIPGFHDPRVFWSGRGEPLIEVNSGNTYGCIGLWIQDLRSVFDPLKKILASNSHRERDEMEGNKEPLTDLQKIDVGALGVAMGYPKLTELTRNPKESRADVEKNWVLFFPNEDEMWVQYNAMGKVVHDEREYRQAAGKKSHATEPISSVIDKEITTSSIQSFTSPSDKESLAPTDLNDLLEDLGLSKLPLHNNSTPYTERLKRHDSSLTLDADLTDQSNFTINSAPATTADSTLSQNSSSSELTIDLEFTTFDKPPLPPQPPADPQLNQSPGRTLSQVLSHGLTTNNLTSPIEPPCFDIESPSHVTDSLNNTGHWHQGTNSLRLILCSRPDFRSRACIHPDHHHSSSTTTDVKRFSNVQYEEYLRAEGAIVHFSIIHRKFSNELDLPMRYERYVLIWEARTPFRTLAVSKYPIVFGGERVRPWTYEEDILGHRPSRDRRDSDSDDIEDKVDEESQFYFTYTPSLAWSNRAKDEDERGHHERGHEDLGTGYLGEEIIVGIGMDDVAQGFVQVEVGELLNCLRWCPGVGGD